MHYVHREAQLERKVEDALEKGFCALLGFPGIGKTTTARYVSAKLSEGKNVVWIIPESEPKSEIVNVENRPIDFGDVKGNIVEVRVNPWYGNIEKFYDVLWTISAVAKNPEYVRDVEKLLKRFVDWLRKKRKDLEDKVLKFGKKLHVIGLTTLHTGEFTEVLAEFMEDDLHKRDSILAEAIKRLISPIVGEEGIVVKVKRNLSGSKFFSRAAGGIAEIVRNLGGAAGLSIEEIAKYGSVFIFGLLATTGAIELVHLIREEREEKRKERVYEILFEKLEKVRDKVVFVVDDLEDARERGLLSNVFQEILELLLRSECKILVVRRFSTTLTK